MSNRVWDKIAYNLLKPLLVNFSQLREVLVYLVSEFYSSKTRQPLVVVTNLEYRLLDVDFAFQSSKAAVFDCHKVEVIVNLAIHNEEGLSDWYVLLDDDVVVNFLAQIIYTVIHLLL